jgi:small-conductance mechanosensitive channel
MKLWSRNSLWKIIVLALLLNPGGLAAQEPAAAPSTSEAPTPQPDVPHLADLIPQGTALIDRFAELETVLKSGSDPSEVQNQLLEINSNLKKYAGKLQKLMTMSIAGGGQLMKLQLEITSMAEVLKGIQRSVTEELRTLVDLQNEWVKEQEQWKTWRTALLSDKSPTEIKGAFDKADHTIDKAFGLILPKLQPLLTLQKQTGRHQTRLKKLTSEIHSAYTPAQKGPTIVDSSPHMFSSAYVSQFLVALRSPLNVKLDQMVQAEQAFFTRQGWILLTQGVFSLVLIFVLFRQRSQLADSERWRFVARRPIAAGLFTILLAGAPFYAGAPISFMFAFTLVAGVAFARLVGSLLDTDWRTQPIYWVITLVILTRLFYTLDLPTPLFRLYFLVAALLSLVFCLRWITKNFREGDSPRIFGVGVFAVAAVFLTVIVFAEVSGEAERAEYLFNTSLRTILVLLAFGLFTYLIRGGLEGAVHSSFLKTIPLVRRNAAGIVRRLGLLVSVLMGVMVLAFWLQIWGIYNSPISALTELLAWGVSIGTQRLTLGQVIAGFSAMVITLLVSWLVQQLLIEDALGTRHVEKGVRFSVGRLIHYVLVFVGFILALIILGVDLTKVTLFASALGIGVGLAARDLVSCFFGGLMIYLDRPFAVGDWIRSPDRDIEGTVEKIGVRLTRIRTFDQRPLYVPNSVFSNTAVENPGRMLNRRIFETIGIRYDDVSKMAVIVQDVEQMLRTHPEIETGRTLMVNFTTFAPSSVDFFIYTFTKTTNLEHYHKVKQDVLLRATEIIKAHGAKIAFPTSTIHVPNRLSLRQETAE